MNNTGIATKFVESALKIGAIELIPEGRKLKSGRISPYFFNSGKFETMGALRNLGTAYVDLILEKFTVGDKELTFDVLYGPPYKGTVLISAIAIILDLLCGNTNTDTRWCSSRKEFKTHGEGGILIGAGIKPGDRVLIIDDVLTTGGTAKKAVKLVQSFGGIPVGLIIAFDRQEKGMGELSAVQEFERDYSIPVHAVATLADLIWMLKEKTTLADLAQGKGTILAKILQYQRQYGI